MAHKPQNRVVGLLLGLSVLLLGGCSGQTVALPIDGSRLSAYSATYAADAEQGGTLSLMLSQDDSGSWSVASTLISPGGSMRSRVDLNLDFTPKASRVELSTGGQDYLIKSEYGEKQLRMQAETPTGPQSAERNLTRPYYDNEQLVVMLPALELQAGKESKFVLVATQSASKLTPTVALVAEKGVPKLEQVTLPNGSTLDCRLIRFKSGVPGAPPQLFWVTTTAPYLVVKIDNGAMTYTLTDWP